ncbi:MAG: hypothetical protein IKB84_05870 [Clostridia bacterium]|nr:hypothetical protein [Clostridia bacterium]
MAIIIILIIIAILVIIYAVSQLGLGKIGTTSLTMLDKEHYLENSDIYRARKECICSFNGFNSRLTVYENEIQIGAKNYNINDIDKVYLSLSSVSSRGYLQIVPYGSNAVGSIDEACKRDDILLLEAVGQNNEATKLKQIIINLMDKHTDIKNERLKKISSKFKFQLEEVTNAGGAIIKTGVVYDLYDSVATFGEWSIDDTKFIRHEDIDFFSMRGSLRQEMSIRGGGLNLGGAILGGALFGGVGAILGSKVGTEISSTTKTIDDRFVFVRSNKLHQDIVIAVGADIEEILIGLRKAIPDKEHINESGFKQKRQTKKKSLPKD